MDDRRLFTFVKDLPRRALLIGRGHPSLQCQDAYPSGADGARVPQAAAADGSHQMTVDFNTPRPGLVYATDEKPLFGPGDPVRILDRRPIGHYRVPIYLRGKSGIVEKVIEPAAVDNEEEGFG